MDPQTDLPDLVEDLEVNIDELTATLTPLLPPSTLSKTASTLPLLEKAKLYTLAAYAIESTLFSALLTSGADAKAHSIFTELGRLKGYFSKIKDAEEHVTKLAEKEGRARLDVGAAQRFIKHGLSGNERYDEMRRERMAREKERALEKARALTNRKFDEGSGKRGAEEGEEGTPNKMGRVDVEEDLEEEEEEEEEEGEEEEIETPNKRGRKSKNTAQKEVEVEEGQDAQTPDLDTKKKRGRPAKKDKSVAESTPQKDTPTRTTRSTAPKTRSEAFQALASASPASASKSKSKAKGKAKGKAK